MFCNYIATQEWKQGQLLKKLVATRFVIFETIKRAEKIHYNGHRLIIETNITVQNKGEIILLECQRINEDKREKIMKTNI